MVSAQKIALKGFTLIELLVVIAVIGVLAGAIIVAINPTEQLARARDAGRQSTNQQVADAVNGYYVVHAGTYPTVSSTWLSTLVTAGDLKALPASASNGAPSSYVACAVTNGAQLGYCYQQTGTDFIVYVKLESATQKNKCTVSGTSPYYVYSSQDAKAGVTCSATDPTAMTFTYVQ